MVKRLRFLLCGAIACLAAVSCSEKQESMEALTARVFGRAKFQFELLDRTLDSLSADGAPICPRTLDPDGNLVTSDIRWWCSGFYPGSLWYTYEYTSDPTIRDLALKHTLILEPIQFRKEDHDVGFQIMCSYGNALRLTGNREYEEVIIQTAKSLSTRFNPAVGCTRSWNSWTFPVIIDNMMNLELLVKASELSGDNSYRDIALTHARTTMKNHFRDDYSTYHLVDYDPETGEVLGKHTVQGFADSSAWSRGQAWGLYGYTMMYSCTGEQDMLDQAVAIAEYLLPRLPEDGVPYWDYDSDLIPDDLRDASAGAIMASALVSLSTFTGGEVSKKYLDTAEKIIRTLAGDEYFAKEGELHGFLLKHSVGHKMANSEVDVPLTYADYYLLEALLRYREAIK